MSCSREKQRENKINVAKDLCENRRRENQKNGILREVSAIWEAKIIFFLLIQKTVR